MDKVGSSSLKVKGRGILVKEGGRRRGMHTVDGAEQVGGQEESWMKLRTSMQNPESKIHGTLSHFFSCCRGVARKKRP